MDNVKDNNGCYNAAIQGINRAKTSTYQEIFIYHEREFIIYNWYWYMAYTCTIDPYDDKFIFLYFSKNVFNSRESIIDSKVSHMFWKVYERFYGVVKKYRKSE